MVATRYAPDWGGWRLVCEATIPQAVALSLGVNPDLLHSWKFRAQRAERAEFEKRISMARRWGLPGRTDIAANYEGREKTIYLREFVRHASSAGWDLPVSLREFAIANEQATSPADRNNPGLRRNRGRQSSKRFSVAEAMKQKLASGEATREQLAAQKEESLAADYGVSRDTARKARADVLSEKPE